MTQTYNLPNPPHLTRQRKLVWEVLKDAHEHLDAETVYLRAKNRSPKISLATVYRSLAFLKSAGLIQELNLGENHNHYEISHSAPHAHFTCLRCGKVLEVESPQLNELALRVCRLQGLQITQLDVHLRGYCPECAHMEALA